MSRTTSEAQVVAVSRPRRFPGLYFGISFTSGQAVADPLAAELTRPSRAEAPHQAVARQMPQLPVFVPQPPASPAGYLLPPGTMAIQDRPPDLHDYDDTPGPAPPPLDQPRPADDDESLNYSDDAEPPPRQAAFAVADVPPATFQSLLAELQRDKDTRYRTFFAEGEEIPWKNDRPAPQPMDELLGRYEFSAVLARLTAVLEPK
jgi:hypothetical protein